MLPSIPQILIVLVMLLVLLIIPYVIYGPAAAKAGFSKWWSLIMIVPLLNVVVVWVFAYIDWPVEANK